MPLNHFTVDGYVGQGLIPDTASASTSKGEANFTAQVTHEWEISNVVVTLNYKHTYPRDLVITLFSPNGTAVQLVNRGGVNNRLSVDNNHNMVIFDDAAVITKIDDTTPIPINGTFKPALPLHQLNGQSMKGTWRLNIKDEADSDIGQLISWKLDLMTGKDIWINCSQSPLNKLN